MDKIVSYFNKQLHSLRKSSPKQLLYSFGIAFITWFVISITMYSDTVQTVNSVPILIDVTGTSAEANDLSVISQDVETVKVKLTTDRTQLNSITNENLVATAQVENVTQAGVYQLRLELSTTDGTPLDSSDVNSIDPSYVTVKFDKYVTRDVPITVDAPNITAKDGYIMDETSPEATPSTISITGPQTQVDSIAELRVTIDETKSLDNYYTYHSTNPEDWKVYDENGSEINFDGLTYDLKDIQVDFKAYMTKNLKLTYTVTNAPSSDFTPSFTLSTSEILVASSDSSLETTEELLIGKIDMREVDENYSKEFSIELPSSYRNLSGIDTVTVSLDSDDYVSREYTNLTNFSLVNVPSSYDVEVVSESLTVELIAPSYVIDEVTQDDFVLSVDLSNVQVTSGLFNAQVAIQLPDYPNAWCVGKYSVALRATDKDDTTETSTTTVTDSPTLY